MLQNITRQGRSVAAGLSRLHPCALGRPRAARLVLSALILTCSLAAVDATTAAATPEHAGHASARLAVRISGLPPGVAARVFVRGPGVARSLRSSRTFTNVAPGRYTLTVGKVRLGRYGTHIAAGSLALPSRPRVIVHVTPRRRTIANARYGTIVNSTVQRLSIVPVSVQGNPRDPSALVRS